MSQESNKTQQYTLKYHRNQIRHNTRVVYTLKCHRNQIKHNTRVVYTLKCHRNQIRHKQGGKRWREWLGLYKLRTYAMKA